MGYKWEILRSAVEQKILFPSVDVYKEYLSQLDNKGVPYEIVSEKHSPTGKIVVIMRKPYNNNKFLEREDMTPDPCFDVPIHMTTDYFNISEEQAVEIVNGFDTQEVLMILNVGKRHYFEETYEALVHTYELLQEYIIEKGYEVIAFKLVCEDTDITTDKFCLVLKEKDKAESLELESDLTITETIHKTTDYFKISKGEASEFVNGVETVEEAKVLDAGVEHYFYETYDELVGLLQDTEFQEYVKEKNYEKLVFEFVCDNLNNNKYCVVLK